MGRVVKPFETLARTRTADGSALTFHRRGGDYFILLDGEELMSTRRHRSERALAELAFDELETTGRIRVLIGGLGLGFTLTAALERMPPEGRVVVAELFPPVVDWNRKYLDRSARALADPRVAVVERDVREVIAGAAAGFDAILLDVDNGPSAWCLSSNGDLYQPAGLAAIRRALTPRGVLGVWSAYSDSGFVKSLSRAGFQGHARTVRARGDKGSRHTIFLGRRLGPRTARRS